jgi:hypothetical protein
VIGPGGLLLVVPTYMQFQLDVNPTTILKPNQGQNMMGKLKTILKSNRGQNMMGKLKTILKPN